MAISYKNRPVCDDTILVLADTESEAIEKTNKFFSYYGTIIEILYLKSSNICCFIGNPKAYNLYIGKLNFIGSNMEKTKSRSVAIGANNIKEAINAVDKAFEDLSSIKHLLLTERQLKTIEYNEAMSYIDYELVGVEKSKNDHII